MYKLMATTIVSGITLLSLMVSAQTEKGVFKTADYKGNRVEEFTLSCELNVSSDLGNKELSYSFLLTKHISRPETLKLNLNSFNLEHLRSQINSRVIDFDDLRLTSTKETLSFENPLDK